MTVAKETVTSYHVRAKDGFSWARIFVQGGRREADHHWGYISVVSDFGNFGHCFSHTGSRTIEQFLIGAGYDYLMNKFFGSEAELFDCEGTIAHYAKVARAARRKRQLSKDELAEFLTCLNNLWGNNYRSEQQAFTYLAERGGRFFYQSEMWNEMKKKPNPQCVGFWEEIWPQFVEQLRADIAAKAIAA